MRRVALIGILMLTFALALAVNGASQGVKLYGNVYDSDNTDVTNQTDVWIGIHIDGDKNGKYDEWELYDTNNSQGQLSTVEWNSSAGSYVLQLDDGDLNWDRGSKYYIIINGTAWYDGNTTCHQRLSMAIEFVIPTEETEHENEINLQTRFMDFVINEFLYDDDGDDDDEWIEIYNPTNLTRSIDFWTLDDNDTSGVRFRIGDIPSVPSFSYVVVHFADGVNETSFGEHQNDTLNLYANDSDVWSNGEDQILLRDAYGLIVDFVAYCSDGNYDSAEDEDEAVQAGIWIAGDFVTTDDLHEDESVGLEFNGIDNDSPSDWIIFKTSSPGESNAQGTPVPEFSLVIILMAFVILFSRTRPGRR